IGGDWCGDVGVVGGGVLCGVQQGGGLVDAGELRHQHKRRHSGHGCVDGVPVVGGDGGGGVRVGAVKQRHVLHLIDLGVGVAPVGRDRDVIDRGLEVAGGDPDHDGVTWGGGDTLSRLVVLGGGIPGYGPFLHKLNCHQSSSSLEWVAGGDSNRVGTVRGGAGLAPHVPGGVGAGCAGPQRGIPVPDTELVIGDRAVL